MENEIVLKINRDEIYFSCKGYSEEFINTISDIINQKRRSLTGEVVGQAEESRPAEIENKKTGQEDGSSAVKLIDKREARRAYQKEYGRKNKDKIYARKKERMLAKKIKKTDSSSSGLLLSGLQKSKEAILTKLDINEGAPESRKIRTYKIYGPGEEENIIEDIRIGLSFQEINKKYGISRNTFYRKKNGLKASIATNKPLKNENEKPAVKTQTAQDGQDGGVKHKKGLSSPIPVSDEDRLKIAADIRLGLFCSQVLKKYHINIKAYSEIKKSVEAEKNKAAGDEDDIKSVKKRLNYGRSINNGSNIIPAAGILKGVSGSSVIPTAKAVAVDINKIQEAAAKEESLKIRPAARPIIRDWQANMIARGL